MLPEGVSGDFGHESMLRDVDEWLFKVVGVRGRVILRQKLGSLLSPGRRASGLGALSLISCTYPGNVPALLIKDGVVLALASVAALTLAGCPLKLDYCFMNAPLISCAGLRDIALP